MLTSCEKDSGEKNYAPQYEEQDLKLPGMSNVFFEKTLDSINARYGSIDKYLEQALELTSDERQILKDKFLCKS